MAGWNGSDVAHPTSKGKSTNRRIVKSTHSPLRGLVAGLIVVIGAAVAFYFLRPTPPAPAPEARAKRGGRIAAHEPSIPKPAVEETPETPVAPVEPEKPKSDIGRQFTNSYGKVYTVKYVGRPGVRYENGVAIEDKPLFENEALNDLDAIYRTEPGFRIYGAFDAETFDKEFVNAMLEKIEVSEDDSDEVAERKRLVMEGRKYLNEQLRAGAKPSEIAAAARKELSELADFKDVCQEAIRTMKEDGCSDEDLELYYRKVNEKLADRSIPPLLSPSAVRERLQAHSLLK